MTTVKEYLINGSYEKIVEFVDLDNHEIMQSQVDIFQIGQEKKQYYIVSSNKDINSYIENQLNGIEYTNKNDTMRFSIKAGNYTCVYGSNQLRHLIDIPHKYDLIFNRQNITLESIPRIPNTEIVKFGEDIQPRINGIYLDKLYTIVVTEWNRFLADRAAT